MGDVTEKKSEYLASLAEKLRLERLDRAPEEIDGDVRLLAQRLAPDLNQVRPDAYKGGQPNVVFYGAPRQIGNWLFMLLFVIALLPSAAISLMLWNDFPRAINAVRSSLAGPGVSALADAPAKVLAGPDQESLKAKQPAKPRSVELAVASIIKAEPAKPAPFLITLDPPDSVPPRSIITISGLSAGSTFSQGRPFGDTEWSLRPDEVGDLRLTPPKTASGRRGLRVELVTAGGTQIASAATRLDIEPDEVDPDDVDPDDVVANEADDVAVEVSAPNDFTPADVVLDVAANAAAANDIAANDAATGDVEASDIDPDPEANYRASLVLRPDEAARINDLIAHGQRMIEVGYISGARAYFQRAAEAGSGEAALALGATYDPAFIAETGVQGIKPELAEARRWYERAKGLGADGAEAKLSELRSAEQMVIEREPTKAVGTYAQEAAVSAVGDTATETTAAVAASMTDSIASLQPEWIVQTGAANVRADPSPTAPTIRVVTKGTRLHAVGRQGAWVEVTDAETSETGWIYSKSIAAVSTP